MKIISFLATLLVSATAAAAIVSVHHDYHEALGGIALENACVTETEIRTINATRVCTKLVPVKVQKHEGGTYTDWVCKKWEVTNLTTPRSYDTQVCVEYRPPQGDIDMGECVRWENRTGYLPKTINIRVVTDDGEYSNFPGVQKKHTFPSCH